MQGDLKQNRTAEGRKRKKKKCWCSLRQVCFGEPGLILERTVSGFWHMISPFVGTLVQRGVKERKGAQKGLKRHGVECVCWYSHENRGTIITRECPPGPSRDLQTWVCFVRAAALKTSSERQGQCLLHRNQNYSPSPPSWAGDLQVQTWLGMLVSPLLWPAGSAPPECLGEHLLQRDARARYHVGLNDWPGLSVTILKQLLEVVLYLF